MLFPAGSFVWTNTTDAVALSACAAAANATAAARTPSKIARFIVPPRVDVRRRPSRGLARNAGQARSSETVKNSPSEGLGSADEAGRGAPLCARTALAAGGAVGSAGPADGAAEDEQERDRAAARAARGLDRDTATPAGPPARAGAAGGECIGGANRRARADLGPGRGGGQAHRRHVSATPHRRPAHALGFLFSARDALIQLATGARAVRGPRLRD